MVDAKPANTLPSRGRRGPDSGRYTRRGAGWQVQAHPNGARISTSTRSRCWPKRSAMPNCTAERPPSQRGCRRVTATRADGRHYAADQSATSYSFYGVLLSGRRSRPPLYPPARRRRSRITSVGQASVPRQFSGLDPDYGGQRARPAGTDCWARGRRAAEHRHRAGAVQRAGWACRAHSQPRTWRSAVHIGEHRHPEGSDPDPRESIGQHPRHGRLAGTMVAARPSVSWLPLYHDMGLIGACMGSLYYARPLVVDVAMAFSPVRSAGCGDHRHHGTISAAPTSPMSSVCVASMISTSRVWT